jgi:hypothetical protein
MQIKAKNNKQIAGRINRLRQAISNYAQQAYDLDKPNSREAEAAILESEKAITEIRDLVATDPVFATDPPMIDLPNYYTTLLRHAQRSLYSSTRAPNFHFNLDK